MSQPVSFIELEIRVRYAECDPMGYLHHSKYFEYFEMGRTELLRAAGFRYRDLEEKGVLFVVAKTACTFKRPARYDDLLKLEVRIVRQTRARIDHEYRLLREGIILCEATTTLACVDRAGRPIPIPEEIVTPADVTAAAGPD
ncbi:MAG: acyl-CoA thioesterase [Phycisphaerae bacterium]